jgi:hypothetical protein
MADTVQRSGGKPSTKANHLTEKLSVGSEALFGDPHPRSPQLTTLCDRLDGCATVAGASQRPALDAFHGQHHAERDADFCSIAVGRLV